MTNEFLWGTATAAYQVEGGINNNWSDTMDAGLAIDHYNRYKEDITLLKQMNNNAYRFSIEWARIEPYKGVWNNTEIEHYKDKIKYLEEQDIEPVVTMFHFTLPKWVNGWDKKETIPYFVRFARLLFTEFPTVKYWITINEPIIYALVSYLLGEWPPYCKNPIKFYRVVKNLAKAHWIIYSTAPTITRLGVAKNLLYFRKVSYGLSWIKWVWNKWWFKLTNNCTDFIGVNYYLPLDLRWSSLCKASTKYFKNVSITGNTSDLGWEICPEGLFEILKELKQYNKPIIITENGIADADDGKRKKFIQDHIAQVTKARSIGINVIGYFYWTLIDNFEWEKGFEPKFGLIAVDEQLNRIPRESYFFYKNLISNKCLLNHFQ
jgi:beta-glucosidase